MRKMMKFIGIDNFIIKLIHILDKKKNQKLILTSCFKTVSLDTTETQKILLQGTTNHVHLQDTDKIVQYK